MAAKKGRIERAALTILIEQKLSTREIGEKLNRGQTSVRYWLKVYDLKTFPEYKKIQTESKLCSSCGETDPNSFYGNKRSFCGNCHNQYTIKAGQEKKRKAREYLGGVCVHCGFYKYQSALDIHHLDPSVKDTRFHQMRGWSWERIERELQDCVLLCKNCHGAYHAGELKINFVK